jgi:DNA-binding CsgD family transcriptional regulator
VLAAAPGSVTGADAVARAAGGSAEVSHLVATLLRDVADHVRAVLAAASVLGTDFGPDLAAAICPASQDVTAALSAAEDIGLVTRRPDPPGSWRFAHALIRDGIYASLGEDQRIALHARAAAALEPAARTAPARGGEVAAHLLQAAPDQAALRRAAEWAVAAARAATATLAFEDAAGGLATALTAAEAAGAGDAERAELLVELATAEYRAGQFAASLRHAAAAADAAERGGQPDLVADAALVVRGIGDNPVATTLLGLCDRALAGPGCSAVRRARLLAQRAAALAELGDIDAAATESAAATAAAEAAGDPTAELDAIRARVAALPPVSAPADRLRLGSRAIDLAEETGQPLAAVLGRVWRIDAAYQLPNLEAVDAEISQLGRLAEATRLPLARWHLLRQQASRAALAGQLALARDRSWEAYRLAVRIQDLSGASLSHTFAVWLAAIRGDATEIPADFFDAAAAAPPIPGVRAGVARALFALGRTDEAQAEYEALRGLPASGAASSRTFGALTQLVDLMVAFADTEMARATYDLWQAFADRGGAAGTGVVFLSGSPHWPLGRLAALLGRTAEALDHFAAAVTANTRIAARPFVALARLDWADALRTYPGPDTRSQARELARQAAAEAHRLDMPGPADRAERLTRDIEQDIHAADPLTRREREIAGLISAGLTNRAIADRLVLSERTIEGHVRSILGKLRLTNRTELAAWALREARPG